MGIFWNFKSDTLRLPNKLISLCPMFSFWPTEFAKSCLIEPKLIIHEFWQRIIEWDRTLPVYLDDRANKWINSAKYLSEIKVPRYTELTCQLRNLSYTFSITRFQRLMVVLLTSELSKAIKQMFNLSLVKVE